MNLKNIVTSLVASAVVLVLAGVFGFLPTQTVKVSATPTLDGVDYPVVSINGVRTYHYKQPITASSSVVCSILNPFNATATIVRFAMNVTSNGIGSAQKLDVSTSSTALASSSPALVKEFSAGSGQFSLLWNPGTTTSTRLIGNTAGNTGESQVILGPAEYLTVRVATATPSTFTTYYGGSCTGLIQQL